MKDASANSFKQTPDSIPLMLIFGNQGAEHSRAAQSSVVLLP